ncbi:MAG: hypothetical protein CFH10_02298, partial [Alphaproteobacteria bacterium MarineAlpha4_Bin2]
MRSFWPLGPASNWPIAAQDNPPEQSFLRHVVFRIGTVHGAAVVEHQHVSKPPFVAQR